MLLADFRPTKRPAAARLFGPSLVRKRLPARACGPLALPCAKPDSQTQEPPQMQQSLVQTFWLAHV